MRKITFTIMTLLLANALHAQLTSAAPYCTPVYPTQAIYNMMQDFKIDGTVIQNFGAMGAYASATTTFKYYNTNTLPTLVKGSGYSFTIDFYSVNDIEPIYFAVWIDYNKNNTFETSEIVMQNNNTTNAALPTLGGAVTPVTKTITIPTTATAGVTRMRILRSNDSENSFAPYSSTFTLPSCFSSTTADAYGSIYDFNVTIGALANNTFNKESFQVFPNPVTNTLFLNDANNTEIYKVSIINQLGQIVLTSDTKFDTGINVSQLSNGIYFAQISTKNNSNPQTIKFIKN